MSAAQYYFQIRVVHAHSKGGAEDEAWDERFADAHPLHGKVFTLDELKKKLVKPPAETTPVSLK